MHLLVSDDSPLPLSSLYSEDIFVLLLTDDQLYLSNSIKSLPVTSSHDVWPQGSPWLFGSEHVRSHLQVSPGSGPWRQGS